MFILTCSITNISFYFYNKHLSETVPCDIYDFIFLIHIYYFLTPTLLYDYIQVNLKRQKAWPKCSR